MATYQFKTTVKCEACMEKVTPFLNEVAGEGAWKVDLQSPDRLLTIDTEEAPGEVVQALDKAGYKAVQI